MNDVSFTLAPGETLGIVGESGSGKTMLVLALMGLTPPGARRIGEAWLHSRSSNGNSSANDNPAQRSARRTDLTIATAAQIREIRGREIAMIFQEPMTALNPVMRVGAQIEEAITRPRSPRKRNRCAPSRRSGTRTRRRPRARTARPPISTSTFRRPAPTRHDRHGPGSGPAHPDRRRAHHGARRHGTKANPRAPRKSPTRSRPSHDFHHPRSRRSSASSRARGSNVRRPHRRRRPGARNPPRSPSSLYGRPASELRQDSSAAS